MSNEQVDAGGRWLTPAGGVLAVCSLLAFPAVYVLAVTFGERTYVPILLTLAIAFLPAFVYRRYWPRRYRFRRAVVWGVAAGTLVAAQVLLLVFAIAPTLGARTAAIVTFLIVVIGNYAVVRTVFG